MNIEAPGCLLYELIKYYSLGVIMTLVKCVSKNEDVLVLEGVYTTC